MSTSRSTQISNGIRRWIGRLEGRTRRNHAFPQLGFFIILELVNYRLKFDRRLGVPEFNLFIRIDCKDFVFFLGKR